MVVGVLALPLLLRESGDRTRRAAPSASATVDDALTVGFSGFGVFSNAACNQLRSPAARRMTASRRAALRTLCDLTESSRDQSHWSVRHLVGGWVSPTSV